MALIARPVPGGAEIQSVHARAPQSEQTVSSNAATSSIASPLASAASISSDTFDITQTITIFQSDQRSVSTVSGDIVTIPTSYLSQPATLTTTVPSLLTGTCTDPYFADVTNAAGVVLRYPQIGCSPERLDCCPFTFQDNISLAVCEADHSKVVRGSYTACCPS